MKEKLKSVLYNPQKLNEDFGDERTKEIVEKTIDFFEKKGLKRLREEHKAMLWHQDWLEYQQEHGLYASLLTPEGFGDEGSRFDLHRQSVFTEALGFYSVGTWYSYQVSFLGVSPIWMSENEAQKKELAQQLKDGHVFAFGLSEKKYGADIYTNAATITPVGDGKYVANGNKYYIGNAHIAPKISTLAKNTETGEWMYFVVDSRHRNFKYVKDIENVAFSVTRLGEYEMVEYPLTDADILKVGNEAFENALQTINVGKFQVGFIALTCVTHAFYEAITHANRRILYGKPVTALPHIRSFLTEAFCRLNAARLYLQRGIDYARVLSDEDRRYMLFNTLAKMRVPTEAEHVTTLIMDVVCARGYETDTHMSEVCITAPYAARLEGTAHVNMSLVLKFIQGYFSTDAGYPEVPSGRYPKDDSNAFEQKFGGLRNIRFNDYRKAYEGVEIPNVQLLLKQATIYRDMMMTAAPDKELSRNMDYMMSLGDIFTHIVYAQLILEGAKIKNVDELLIDQIFGYLVRDINKFALEQLSNQINTPEQEEYLKEIMLVKPQVDKERDSKFFDEYVAVLDGAYMMKDCPIGLEN